MSETTETQHQEGPQVYLAPKIIVDDELSQLKKLVYLFSCQRKMSGQASTELREKLLLLVALYIKYGYNDDAKTKAEEILGVKRANINSMNLELRNQNYLIKNSMNNRINHLHEDLQALRGYVQSNDSDSLFFIIQIVNE